MMQLFLHGSALKSEEVFHLAQMQRGDMTGTKCFKSAIAILWLHKILEEDAVPPKEFVAINAHLDFRTFVQLEFHKAKTMVSLGSEVRNLPPSRRNRFPVPQTGFVN